MFSALLEIKLLDTVSAPRTVQRQSFHSAAGSTGISSGQRSCIFILKTNWFSSVQENNVLSMSVQLYETVVVRELDCVEKGTESNYYYYSMQLTSQKRATEAITRAKIWLHILVFFFGKKGERGKKGEQVSICI